MYLNKKILAIIPARGGSKGIPGKNIKKLGDKPLISWSIEAARQSKYLDRTILSSEDSEIISIAKKWGCEVPFIRPQELAEDNSSSMDVLFHALNNIPEIYDFVLLLQPTSPFRSSQDIDSIIESCISNNRRIMVSVSNSQTHPYLMYKIEGDKLLPVIENAKLLRRQELPAIYELNGALYIAEIEHLKKTRGFTGDEVYPYVMAGPQVDLDDPIDWAIAETLIKEKLI